jgi:hypothetical protein
MQHQEERLAFGCLRGEMSWARCLRIPEKRTTRPFPRRQGRAAELVISERRNVWDRTELSLTVTNAADKRGIGTSYSGVFWHEVTYIQPRTLTLRLTGRL